MTLILNIVPSVLLLLYTILEKNILICYALINSKNIDIIFKYIHVQSYNSINYIFIVLHFLCSHTLVVMYGIMYSEPEVYRSCTNTFLLLLYLIALDELAGGIAADYSNHVFMTNNYLVSHIVNTLTDRELSTRLL